MKKVALRVTLLIVFAAAAGAAAYVVWTAATAARAEAEATRRFDAAAHGIARGVLELRAAQQAYVAAGQGDDFWKAKTAASLNELRARLSALRAIAASPHAHTAVDNATGILQDFEQMDRRAREHTANDQRLLASDLIFSDGLEMTGAALSAVDEARTAESQLRDTAIADHERTAVIAAASSAGIALLVIALLIPVPKVAVPPPASVAPAAQTPLIASGPIELTLALDGDSDNWSVPPPPRPIPEPTAETTTLGSIASLCTELARVVDTRSLSSILERTATVLNASGIVLWIADPDGRELSPIVAYGYSDQLLARLGTLNRDAENATAAAFRTGLVQTVKSDTLTNGAIAAPLVTPAGSVGVMAAEVRSEGEKQGAKLAAAAIVAAQLATLVGPPVPRPSKAEIAGI